MKLTESSHKSFLCVVSCVFAVSLLLFCATAPAPEPVAPPPDWAQSASAITRVYPDDTYIARRGRGQTREAAEAAAAAEIARYFTSQISANSGFRTATSQQNGILNESLETETSAFVTSEINLAGLRYAPDAFYNKAANQWESVAYLDRTEAWTIYEPQVRQRSNAFIKLFDTAEAEVEPFKKFLQYKKVQAYAEQEVDSYFRFSEILNPREARSFSNVSDLISTIPQRIGQSRASASIFVDCPVDYNGMTATALTQALSDEGLPISRSQSAASAVCTASVEEGLQTLSAGTFYTPAVRITITGKSGAPLASYTIRVAERSGAVNPDVAKKRAYTALAKAVQKTFSTEFSVNSEKQYI
jgi:hypothetical protein